MKNLSDFVDIVEFTENNESKIDEGRVPKNKEANFDPNPEIKDFKGLNADDNVSRGLFELDAPTDDEALDSIDLDDPENSESLEDLIDKFDAEEDFFVQGEAGWAKTSIIKRLAHKYGKYVLTVYLDKAEATDLGGIPVAVKDEKTKRTYQDVAMPTWAMLMNVNKDKEFLLFFDEMNQADPQVMNALMPIVLEKTICGVKFDNFFVGAAGNFASENDAIYSDKLSGPLESRFKPIIIWQKDWKGAFKYLHKKYDDKLGKPLVDEFEKNCELFFNPREVEMKIFMFLEKLKQKGNLGRNKAAKYFRRLKNLAKPDLNRSGEKELMKLSEFMAKYISGGGLEDNGGRGRRGGKDSGMVDQKHKTAIKEAMEDGFIEDKDGNRWGISRENIHVIWPTDRYNADQLDKLIRNLEDSGVKFKFEKNEEWQKKGYKDPAGGE